MQHTAQINSETSFIDFISFQSKTIPQQKPCQSSTKTGKQQEPPSEKEVSLCSTTISSAMSSLLSKNLMTKVKVNEENK